MLCVTASTRWILWYLNCYMHQKRTHKAIQYVYYRHRSPLTPQLWLPYNSNSLSNLKGHSSDLILHFHKDGRLARGLFLKKGCSKSSKQRQKYPAIPPIPIIQLDNIFSSDAPRLINVDVFQISLNARIKVCITCFCKSCYLCTFHMLHFSVSYVADMLKLYISLLYTSVLNFDKAGVTWLGFGTKTTLLGFRKDLFWPKIPGLVATTMDGNVPVLLKIPVFCHRHCWKCLNVLLKIPGFVPTNTARDVTTSC